MLVLEYEGDKIKLQLFWFIASMKITSNNAYDR
jgi:hypothetical protein